MENHAERSMSVRCPSTSTHPWATPVWWYRTMSASYLNQSRRLQWAAQAFSQTQFFYGLDPRLIADFGLILDRDDALARLPRPR